MEMREIRSFVLLAEAGSIQEAAERAHLSPAAVHKHLKTLEHEFDAQLYAKQQGRLLLTDAGKTLLPFMKEILRNKESASIALKEWRDSDAGLVRVGAGPAFSTYLLPALVRRYRRRFPRVEVFIETGTGDHLLERLRSGHLDLAFDLAVTARDDDAVEPVALWQAPLGFISGRPEIPIHCRLRDLAKSPFVLYQQGSHIERLIAGYLDQLNFWPTVVMRSDSAEAIKAMLRAGLGVSVLFLWNITSDVRSRALSVIRTEAPPLVSQMALVKLRTSYTPKAVLRFIELARRMDWKNLHSIPQQN
jgi:DNA-binding transcriptional LysR family regulator